MDPMLLEQHLRAPLRFFPDSMLAQFAAHDAESASAAVLEKARQNLQMFGRVTPYPDLLMQQIYQRSPSFAPLNLSLWQNQLPPQLSAGFLTAAALANSLADRTQSALSSPPAPQFAGTSPLSLTATQSTSSSDSSSSPDLRVKHFARFSPYQMPNNHQSNRRQISSPQSTAISRNSPN